ncbi:hypothetical protein evm_006650 [Chilo suppressalis]|nr:hypothetical protein evm_006650 [Chilo suppressalis]
MFRVFYLTVVIAAVTADDVAMHKRKCVGPLLAAAKCCSSLPELPEDYKNNMKECMQLPDSPVSCDRDICMSTKDGTGKDNGEVIYSKAQEVLEKTFADSPELLKTIKEQCVEGDIERYGLPDTCELKKFRHCIEIQTLKACNVWSGEGNCGEVKEKAQECFKLFN